MSPFTREKLAATLFRRKSEAWMVADRLAEAGVPVLIDALQNLPGSFDQLGARLDNAAILHTALRKVVAKRFTPKRREARVGRDPRTGDPIRIPAGTSITFRPGKPLRETLG